MQARAASLIARYSVAIMLAIFALFLMGRAPWRSSIDTIAGYMLLPFSSLLVSLLIFPYGNIRGSALSANSRRLMDTYNSLKNELPSPMHFGSWAVCDPVFSKMLGSKDAVISAMQRYGDDHRTFVVNALANISSMELRSGRYHMYRGVLSGIGRSLLSTYEWCGHELVLRKLITEADRLECLADLREEIRSVG